MFRYLLSFSLVFAVFASLPAEPSTRPDHQLWENILQKHVNYTAGTVNYRAIRAEKSSLEAYIQQLQDNSPQTDWSRNEKLAYWINTYNAFTVKLIVDNYPISSITKLEKPWDQDFIKLGDKSYTLNQIENNILRKYTPKIHFSINCASISCPPLYNHAFTEDNVNTYLTQLTKNFLNDSKRTKINGSSARVSQIFEWYAVDFTTDGSIIPFLNKYLPTELSSSTSVSYLEYNWNLNE